jgi:hypothetical protein
MKHIAVHFEKGFKIEDWKLPFPGPKDKKPPGPFFSNYRKGEDDDDDDNDGGFGGNSGNSRGKPSGYGTSDYKSRGTQYEQSSSSQDRGSYFQDYRQQGYATYPLDSVRSPEIDIRLFSAKQGSWISTKAKLDTGCAENWISTSLVKTLGLLPKTMPSKSVITSSGAVFQSSQVLIGVNWSTADKRITSTADFHILPPNSPFNIILGVHLLNLTGQDDPLRISIPDIRKTTSIRALKRPFKPSLALERYLNDPGNRILALSASLYTTKAQPKAKSRNRPLGMPLTSKASWREAYEGYVDRISSPSGKPVLRLKSLPGGGRTYLARNYIRHHRNDLRNGVFWVNSKIHHDVKNSFWDIAVQAILQRPKGASIVTSIIQNRWRTVQPNFGGGFFQTPRNRL